MSEIKVQENVTVTYKNDKITIKGDTFVIEGSLPSSELMKVYWGNTGKGSVKITLDVPDETAKVVEPVVKKEEPKKVQEEVVPVKVAPAKTAPSKNTGTPAKKVSAPSKSTKKKNFGPDWFDEYK